MKYASARILKVVAALAVVALLSIPTVVQAQSGQLKVNVPFEFYIGDQKFPAGLYTLWQSHLQRSVVRVSDRNGHNSMILTIPVARRLENEAGQLIFNRYGGYHFLSEVRWMGSTSGGQFPQSLVERRLAKNIAAEQVATTNTNR
jgi:hypothetical protein